MTTLLIVIGLFCLWTDSEVGIEAVEGHAATSQRNYYVHLGEQPHFFLLLLSSPFFPPFFFLLFVHLYSSY